MKLRVVTGHNKPQKASSVLASKKSKEYGHFNLQDIRKHEGSIKCKPRHSFEIKTTTNSQPSVTASLPLQHVEHLQACKLSSLDEEYVAT